MSVIEVSTRYAKALFDSANAKSNQEKVFNELRVFQQVIDGDAAINDFVHSVLIRSDEKEATVKKAIEGRGFSSEVESFLCLLAKKGRLKIFEAILDSYQVLIDEANKVTRGQVRSSYELRPEERSAIETKVSQVTNKKVILSYTVDASIIGGLIAEVDGFRFDDTLTGHLRRLKEEINRSTH